MVRYKLKREYLAWQTLLDYNKKQKYSKSETVNKQ